MASASFTHGMDPELRTEIEKIARFEDRSASCLANPAGRGLAPGGGGGPVRTSGGGPAFRGFRFRPGYLIQGTSFPLLHTVARDTVRVIDIRDQRGRRSADALRRFLRDARAPEGDAG